MRLSTGYRLVRAKGFFIGQRFFEHQYPVLGFAVPFGVGVRARLYLATLGEGVGSRMAIQRQRPFRVGLR
jgi:hypothetical protein